MDVTTIKEIQIDHAKLAEAREAKGLSQADVARELGFIRQQVSQFEKGIGLTSTNFTKLALFYNKPIEFFISK